jgi:hypothetical protein
MKEYVGRCIYAQDPEMSFMVHGGVAYFQLINGNLVSLLQNPTYSIEFRNFLFLFPHFPPLISTGLLICICVC